MKSIVIKGFTFIAASVLFTSAAFAGSITGTVKFDGDVPKLKNMNMDADPVCATKHEAPVASQVLLLGEGNTMGNVFVYVKNPPAGNYPPPTEPLVVDQKGCNYHPHVMGAMVGQPVKILNPDGTLHNVHAMSKINPEFNLAMPKFRTEVLKTWDKAEFMFALKCDVHPWMTGWLSIMDHPFFAVTAADGKFEIPNLPDGTYTIEAWQEKLGPKTMQIKVEGGKGVADIVLEGPKRKS